MLRYSRWDSLLIALSALHAALLLTVPSVPLVAFGLWWNANTISHNFIHRPFFRSRRMNRLYAIYLSALLGFPQSLWRARHLRHHAEIGRRPPEESESASAAGRASGGGAARASNRRWPIETGAEISLVLLLWTALYAIAPSGFLTIYLPGWALGLCLCQLQGHFEHARGTTSHYGRLYNWLFFNDGYHVEHHERPGEHWTRLRARGCRDPLGSRWPPVLRWLDAVNLETLERLVLRSARLQQFVLRRHERAFRALLPEIAAARRVVIVGGGLFPRTALLLRRVLPGASLTIVDASARNLETARAFVGDGIEFIHAPFEPRLAIGADLVVVPLAFRGDRALFYHRPPAPMVIVHDWLWSRHRKGSRVSWLLFKRMNLVTTPVQAGLGYIGTDFTRPVVIHQ